MPMTRLRPLHASLLRIAKGKKLVMFECQRGSQALANVHSFSETAFTTFRIMAANICVFLSQKDLGSWKAAYPKSGFVDALNELTGKAAVRKYITSRTPKAAAKKFPSIVKNIISRAQLYPLNKCVGRDAAVKHITDLLESTSEQRLKRLKDAHVYRSSSSFCKAYINKTTAAYRKK